MLEGFSLHANTGIQRYAAMWTGDNTSYWAHLEFSLTNVAGTRECLERRYRLLPTLYTLAHEASEEGLPVMRPLVMYAPGDEEALRTDDAFLFGKELLVAPVVRQGRTRRLAYLPEGRWLPFFNLEAGGTEGVSMSSPWLRWARYPVDAP